MKTIFSGLLFTVSNFPLLLNDYVTQIKCDVTQDKSQLANENNHGTTVKRYTAWMTSLR